MKRFLTLFFICSALVAHSQVLRKRTTMLMGGRFDITIVAEDSASAEMHIDTVIREISRIENLISDWIPATQVSQVNANAGVRPVRVDQEVFELAERALELSRLTEGAFDISFAAMERIWKFDGSMIAMPSPESVRKSVEKVGYKNIVLDKENRTIFLKKKGMKIGFGALGEGYAADRCRDMMLKKGIKAGIVNGSGDMSVWGKQPDGSDWLIGINDPMNPGELFAVIPVLQGAVVTSGSYEKFVMLNGKRYSHIINPATGYPASGLTSVTVFGPSAERANGFSTSLMVMGKKAGLRFLSRFPEYSCLMITDSGKVFSSPNLGIPAHQ
jgi:thiamine biosynthesis lipoprotein